MSNPFIDNDLEFLDFIERYLNEPFRSHIDINKRNYNPDAIIEILKKEPRLIPQVASRIHKCIGSHILYIILIKDKNGNLGVKVGITHNDVNVRMREDRYKDDYDLVRIIEEYPTMSSAANEMETELTNKIESNLQLEVEAPGKGELYKPDMEKMLVDEADKIYDKYKNKIGWNPK